MGRSKLVYQEHLTKLSHNLNSSANLRVVQPHEKIALTFTEGLQELQLEIVDRWLESQSQQLDERTAHMTLCNLNLRGSTCFFCKAEDVAIHQLEAYDEPKSNSRCLQTLSKFCFLQRVENYYQTIEILRKSSTSTISKARKKLNDQIVAIKAISLANITSKVNTLSCFYEELRIHHLLDHDRVVKLLSFYESQEQVHLIFEYAQFGDVFDLIEIEHKFSETEVKEFCKRLLSTLEYIHSQGVIHRDLKPENLVLISNDLCDFKITDFGLACQKSDQEVTLKCGSVGFMAPEMLRGESYNSKVDMFSVGVITFLLYSLHRLTGHMPFIGRNDREVLRRNARGVPYLKTKAWRELGISAQAFVLELLTCDPNSRPDARSALLHPWLSEAQNTKSLNAAETIL